MILKPETKELLLQLSKSPYGRALQEYLHSALDEIRDITTTKSWEETQGRQFAVKLILDLFSSMQEKKVQEKTKNQYE